MPSEPRVANEFSDSLRRHLIADLTHDLRTPLVAVRGYTRMLLDERAGAINPTQREYLSIVTENTRRVIELLDSLGRLTSDQPLKLEPVDVRELWAVSLKPWRTCAKDRSIKITESIPSIGLVVLGDRERLAQAFDTILQDCMIQADGRAEIRVNMSEQAEHGVVVTISLVGTGTADEAPREISPFRDSDKMATCSHGDVESGLSLARDLIALHGGNLTVSSENGQGTTIGVTLPAH